MPTHRTRRALLSAGSAVAAAGLAGCSAVPGYGPSSDQTGPDAGKDSYGIVVVNESDQTYTVTVTARPRGGDVFFEETVESTPEEDREWDQVLTDDGMHLVRANVEGQDLAAPSQPLRNVVVGKEHSPEVDDVLVVFNSHPEDVPYLVVGLDYRDAT
jgi:hypothetical protein